MTTVWDYSEAAGTDLLVLLALADIADENGECWPSVGYMARKCRISGRTVQRCVRSLESLGEVVVIIEGGKASTAGGTRSNRYRIVVHMPEELEGDILTGSDTGDGDGVTPVTGGGVTRVSPDTPLLPVKETSNTPDAFGDEFVTLWEMYPRKDDSSKALKAYSARRLAGVPAEDLLTATVNYQQHVQAQNLELRYVKYGSTFFGSDEPWRDYLQPVTQMADAQPTEDPLAAWVRYGKKYAWKTDDAFQSLLEAETRIPAEVEAAWLGRESEQPVMVAS